MQFDIQKPSDGGKISDLITSTGDRWLRAPVRAEVPFNAAMTDQITESK